MAWCPLPLLEMGYRVGTSKTGQTGSHVVSFKRPNHEGTFKRLSCWDEAGSFIAMSAQHFVLFFLFCNISGLKPFALNLRQAWPSGLSKMERSFSGTRGLKQCRPHKCTRCENLHIQTETDAFSSFQCVFWAQAGEREKKLFRKALQITRKERHHTRH